MNPVVSIIVPIYNAEDTLCRCVDSLLNQTYHNLEILLVDDGSIDGSGKMCDEYAKKDNRIKVFHQINLGVSAARNKALENVTGDFLTFVDADDELLFNAIEVMIERAVQIPADLILGGTICRGSNGNERYEPIENSNIVLCGDDFLNLILDDHPYTYTVWRVLYNRRFLSDTRFADGRTCNEDSFFNFECSLKKPVVGFVNEYVYRHIYNSNSITHSVFSIKKYNDILYFLEKKREIIESEYPGYRKKSYNNIVKCHMNLLQNMCNTHGAQWRELKKKSISEFHKYKQFFIPQIQQDRKMFFILSHDLYDIYSFLLFVKNKI